jgi:peptidoglycan hydrolase CwlO-like protein
MKKINIFVLSLLMILIFSFDVIHGQTLANDADKLVQVKEIRQSIKHHLKANEDIENKIERKSRQIDKMLVKLSEDNLIPQKVIDEQLNPRLEEIMTELMQVGKYERAAWRHMKRGNNLVKNKKYNEGIKHLREADTALKNKHEAMMKFAEELDAFLTFLNSLQNK